MTAVQERPPCVFVKLSWTQTFTFLRDIEHKSISYICRSLTELTADVQETSEAIAAIANDDSALAAICLSERKSDAPPSLLKYGTVVQTHAGRFLAPCRMSTAPTHVRLRAAVKRAKAAAADGSLLHPGCCPTTGPRPPAVWQMPVAVLPTWEKISARFPTQCPCPSLARSQDHQQTAAMYRGAGLLESYQRQVQSMDGALRELEENIDTVREVRAPCLVGLDSSRIAGRSRPSVRRCRLFALTTMAICAGLPCSCRANRRQT